ncbi:hypothetical protein HNQ51_000135 [Inhella inkyongensis]|uniref:Uncharacterized protein n=1 Tax=Inhella inkyongensis TaxID=392593 RepID=A0A840S020_9BURK|nr:hypothetical protein [Inhella inkyongensis]MBB5202842.1 hypothetical protein [Inhella inkyongensis]
MLSLAFALLVAAAISFAFRSTRAIGILCVGLLTFALPWVVVPLFVLAACLFLYIHYR